MGPSVFSTSPNSSHHNSDSALSSSLNWQQSHSSSQDQRILGTFQQHLNSSPVGASSPFAGYNATLLITAPSMRHQSPPKGIHSNTLSLSNTAEHTSNASLQFLNRRQSSEIPMIEDGTFTNQVSSCVSFIKPPSSSPSYTYLGWPKEHPTFFASSIQKQGFRVRSSINNNLENSGSSLIECEKNYNKRILLEYQISSVRIPLGANTFSLIPIRSLLLNHPQFFENIKKFICKQNQELLNQADLQLTGEALSLQRSIKNPSSTLPEIKLRGGIELPDIAIAQAKGLRDYQEDVCIDTQFKFLDKSISLVALFDGHGSSPREDYYPATFCSQEIVRFVLERLHTETNGIDPSYHLPLIKDALTLAFVDLSYSYRHPINNKRPGIGGSTVNAAFMIEDRLWVANLGDSRAILIDPKGKLIALSIDAKPNNPRFKKEVEERGGTINPEGTRVGTLAITRAIGDHDVLGVSARADVCYFDCPKDGWEGWYLVQTCDGIHEEKVNSRFSKTISLSSQELGNIVYFMLKACYSIEEIAKEIVLEAFTRGSGDNLSVSITPVKSMLKVIPSLNTTQETTLESISQL